MRKGLHLRNLLALGALIVATLSCGCANGGSLSLDPPLPRNARASVSVCNSTPNDCAAGASYHLDSLRDLGVHVLWSGVPTGTHTQIVEFVEPDGGLYTAKSQAFVIDDSSNGNIETRETLPITGTPIVQRSILGQWTVRVWLDTSASFSEAVRLDP